MKKLSLLFCLFLCLQGLAQTQQPKQYHEEYGPALLVLTETDPGLAVAGADVPTFALYKGGQIIYKTRHRGKDRYMQTRLAREQQQELLSSLMLPEDLLQLPLDTTATKAKGQPTIELLFNLDTLQLVRVYGNLRTDTRAREKAPLAFLKVYDKLIAFNDRQARPWLPPAIEVLITDYDVSSAPALAWPADWPTLKSASTVWRSEKLYSLYLDKQHHKALQRLMKKLKDKQGVEINGKKFRIASYRLPFPNIP